jgi:hypothetical protein
MGRNTAAAKSKAQVPTHDNDAGGTKLLTMYSMDRAPDNTPPSAERNEIPHRKLPTADRNVLCGVSSA